jgi:hypothetical protein
MSGEFQPALVRRLLRSNEPAPQVAYSARAAAAALQVADRHFRRLINDGLIPARTGGRARGYIIAGGTLIDIHGGPLDGINDHRDPELLDPDQPYYRAQVAQLLGVSPDLAHRFLTTGVLRVDERANNRPLVYGRTMLEFLSGRDEPIRHAESA